MVASSFASCSSNVEIPSPEQFIIQTLLYQFAGYELNKDRTPSRIRNSLESPQLRAPSEHAMRSIQVQVGPSLSSKCEQAQTVTTFILTDPCTVLQSDKMPIVEGKINYICGPDIPGIRTKLAMNLNKIPSADEDENGAPKPQCSNDQVESFEQYDSSICSHQQNVNVEAPEKQKTNFKLMKNDKYVFITVTPVQTDLYEPNYYIILTSTDDVERKEETKNNKKSKSNTKPKPHKSPLVSPTNKSPLDRFGNQIFSLDTLKSSDFFDYFQKKPEVIRTSEIIDSSSDPKNPTSLVEFLQKKKKEQTEEMAMIDGAGRKVEDKICGPDTCENFKFLSDNDLLYEGIQKKIENAGSDCDTCEYSERVKKDDSKTIERQKSTKYKECESNTCEHLEISQKKEKSNEISTNSAARTKAVSCETENGLKQDELNGIKMNEVDASTSPNPEREMKTKEIQCEMDTCGFKKYKNACNNNICTSMQTEEKTSKEIPTPMVVTVGCEADTIKKEPEKEGDSQMIEYCDMQVCTNNCKQCEVANQVRMEKNTCAPEDCGNFCENLKFEEKSNLTEEIPTYRDSSCNTGGKDDPPGKDEVSCASNCDPNDCAYVKALDEQKILKKESTDLKTCHDNICPEKYTSPVQKLPDETVRKEIEKFPQNGDLGIFKSSKKIVNTKLEDQDVFALKAAIDRFAKTKTYPIDEE